jgi:hypothetical protein
MQTVPCRSERVRVEIRQADLSQYFGFGGTTVYVVTCIETERHRHVWQTRAHSAAALDRSCWIY